MNENLQKLVGQKYVFPDGNGITIAQIKRRDEEMYWVTYYTQNGPGIPQKLVMPYEEFCHHFGHLFNIDENT